MTGPLRRRYRRMVAAGWALAVLAVGMFVVSCFCSDVYDRAALVFGALAPMASGLALILSAPHWWETER